MKHPPVWAERLLRALLEARSRDSVAGDLFEEYQERAQAGPVWYISQVLSFVNCRSLGRLPFALFPRSAVWAAVAGLVQLTMLWLLPQAVSMTWGVFCIVAVVLAVGSAIAVGRAPDSRASSRFVLWIAALWLLPFVFAAVMVLRASPFTPVPGVVLFFITAPCAALHAANRSGKVVIGITTAVANGFLIALLTAVMVYTLNEPHPPLGTLVFLPGVAGMLGAVAAPFGRRYAPTFQSEFLRLDYAPTAASLSA
jgi:hypothetical protein